MVLGQLLGRFPVGAANRSCLASLSWNILDTSPNQRSRDLSIRRSGSTCSNYAVVHFVASVAPRTCQKCCLRDFCMRYHLSIADQQPNSIPTAGKKLTQSPLDYQPVREHCRCLKGYGEKQAVKCCFESKATSKRYDGPSLG